ncbi:MAG: hypothetical protein FJ263_01465 [Planctomycetes bacterium]|nr:hypothetical protein [Planctomycetota bacterium]
MFIDNLSVLKKAGQVSMDSCWNVLLSSGKRKRADLYPLAMTQKIPSLALWAAAFLLGIPSLALRATAFLLEIPSLALRAAAFLLGIPLFALRAAVYKADKRERKK